MPRRPPEINPNPKKIFSPEEQELVRTMTADGQPLHAIAKALGTSITTLRRHFRGELRIKISKPKPTWSEDHRRIVAALAGFGALPAEIARILKTTEARVRRDFEREIDTASTEMTAQVATSVFNAARSGNVTAAMFWLRARAGWDDSANRRARDLATSATQGELQPEIAAEATRANVREAARHLSAAGRAALRTVLDEMQSNEARVVNA